MKFQGSHLPRNQAFLRVSQNLVYKNTLYPRLVVIYSFVNCSMANWNVYNILSVMQCVHIFIPPCYFHTGYGDLLMLKKLFLFLKITCFENKMIILLVKRLNLWKSFGLNSRDVSKCNQTFKKQLCCTQTGTLKTVLRKKRQENTNQCSAIFLIQADNANLWILCKFTVFPNSQTPFIFQGKNSSPMNSWPSVLKFTVCILFYNFTLGICFLWLVWLKIQS